MTALHFLDTNILIYAAAGKSDAPGKHDISLQILREKDVCLSVQVVGEFIHVARRKFLKEMGVGTLSKWVDRLFELPCATTDEGLIRGSFFLAERFKVSYWDAALLSASEKLQAQILYTEDLSHGQQYGSVTAINPFKEIAA